MWVRVGACACALIGLAWPLPYSSQFQCILAVFSNTFEVHDKPLRAHTLASFRSSGRYLFPSHRDLVVSQKNER